jgi:hypothetical protein
MLSKDSEVEWLSCFHSESARSSASPDLFSLLSTARGLRMMLLLLLPQFPELLLLGMLLLL